MGSQKAGVCLLEGQSQRSNAKCARAGLCPLGPLLKAGPGAVPISVCRRCQGRGLGWHTPAMAGHIGTAPLTDGEQLLLPLAGRGLQSLQKAPGDMQDVIGVREESFQVQLGQLKGTKMPQAKPNRSEVF